MPTKTRIDITTASIMRVVAVGLGLLFIFTVYDLLILLLFAVVLASSITPFVNWLEDRHIPRAVSLMVVVLVLIGILSLIAILIAPPLVKEFQNLAENFPTYQRVVIAELTDFGFFDNEVISSGIQQMLDSMTLFFGRGIASVSSFIFQIFGGVVATITVLLSAFYLALDRRGVEKLLRLFAPEEEEPYVINLWSRAQKKIGQWARGQLILMLLVGSVSFIALKLLGVPFALALALLAMLFEVVPYVGPILAGTAAVAVALFTSPWLALAVLAVYIGIQQLESQIVVPLLYRKILKIHPVIVIFALLIGARFGGIAGLVLAIPVTTIVTEFITDYAHGRIR